ncbi:MAG: endonuclease domain-containing protein, partial [Gammaproteobacteria bacterium]
TDAEQMLWQALRQRQLKNYKFRRQYPYGDYVLDFVCLEAKLVIEVDGGQHQEQFGYDIKRTRWLEHQGFQVLRFWNNEVMFDLDNVLEVVWRSLNLEIQPPSRPSP